MEAFTIRRELPEEQRKVESLIRDSFWNVYRPGCLEHYVMHCLHNDKAFIPELNLVMVIGIEGKEMLVGQVMCMKAELTLDDGTLLPIMTLGPICIHPDYKRQGYGKALLDNTLEKAAGFGFGAVCFEGNIDFYGNSGFTFASRYGIRYHGLPEGADASFFLCTSISCAWPRVTHSVRYCACGPDGKCSLSA